MPQRKDPVFPARTAVAVCVWPGVNAEKIEALVTRKIEDKIAENPTITKLESVVRTSVSITYFNIDERIADTSAQFDDVKIRLDGIKDLPSGTQPIVFLKDFAETAALMLTVASPPVGGVELDLQGPRPSRRRSASVRANAAGRAAVVVSFPHTLDAAVVERPARLLATFFEQERFGRDLRVAMGQGFVVIDGELQGDDAAILRGVRRFIDERLHGSEFHPDVWQPAIVRDPKDTRDAAGVGGRRTSTRYRDLDEFTDLISQDGPDAAGDVEGRAGRGAWAADLSRLLPAAPGGLRCAPGDAAVSCSPRATRSFPAASSKSDRRTSRSIRRASSPARRRSARCSRRARRACCRSTCATCSTSAATTRARRSS